MQHYQGWKTILAFVYGIICIFDFIIVPGWLGLTRHQRDLAESLELLRGVDAAVQLILVENWTYTHNPFTLRGNGLFHLAFGALLTGSAVSKFSTPSTPPDRPADK